MSNQLNQFGVDLSALYAESHPIVAHGNASVYTGEHYVPYSHLFVAPDEVDDLQDNVLYRKYIVTNTQGKSTTYVCDDEPIATTTDEIHGDTLTCGDFIPNCFDLFGVPADTAMVAWLPKLPPLPKGHYQVELILGLKTDQETAFELLPAGEWHQVVFQFDVHTGNRPKT